jgi:hypothetical protein
MMIMPNMNAMVWAGADSGNDARAAGAGALVLVDGGQLGRVVDVLGDEVGND